MVLLNVEEGGMRTGQGVVVVFCLFFPLTFQLFILLILFAYCMLFRFDPNYRISLKQYQSIHIYYSFDTGEYTSGCLVFRACPRCTRVNTANQTSGYPGIQWIINLLGTAHGNTLVTRNLPRGT